jgi:hypothetical protein
MNQHGQIFEQYRLRLVREETCVYSAQQAAQIYSTEGGKRFLETNDYQDSAFLDAIRPYMGQELRSSFSLDRSPEDFLEMSVRGTPPNKRIERMCQSRTALVKRRARPAPLCPAALAWR